MKNELLKIGPLTVYGYGAMIALGVIAAWVVTELRAKKHRLSSDHVFALVLWGLLGGLLCAKLLCREKFHCCHQYFFCMYPWSTVRQPLES